MNEKTYETLKAQTKYAAEFDALQQSIKDFIFSLYNALITTKTDLYPYIYKNLDVSSFKEKINFETCEKDFPKIDNSAKLYLNYFDEKYQNYNAANLNNIESPEYALSQKYPEIYTAFSNFFLFLCRNGFITKQYDKKGCSYNIPLWFAPVFSAFIRVLYLNKKWDNLSPEKVVTEIKYEMKQVIFKSIPIIHNSRKDLCMEENLNLLYIHSAGLLYRIVSAVDSGRNCITMPYVPCHINEEYMNSIFTLFTISNYSFFMAVIENYWKTTWNLLSKNLSFKNIQKHYAYETKDIHLSRIKPDAYGRIGNMLLDKFNVRFSSISSTFEYIKKIYGKCGSDTDRGKVLSKIEKSASKHLDTVENYNTEILRPLCDNIHKQLTADQTVEKMIVTFTDSEKIYQDFCTIFQITFGIYDLAFYTIKILLENQSLSDEYKFRQLSTQIFPKIPDANKDRLYYLFASQCNCIYHIMSVTNIAPKNFGYDISNLQELQSFFGREYSEAANSIEKKDFRRIFDELAEKMIDYFPKSDSLFPFVFRDLYADKK